MAKNPDYGVLITTGRKGTYFYPNQGVLAYPNHPLLAEFSDGKLKNPKKVYFPDDVTIYTPTATITIYKDGKVEFGPVDHYFPQGDE